MASTRPSVVLTTFPPPEGLCQVLPPGPDASHISMLSRICTWCRLFPEPHTGSRVPARPLPSWYTALCTPPKPGQLRPHCSPFWCTAIPPFLLLRLTPQESCRRLSGGSREGVSCLSTASGRRCGRRCSWAGGCITPAFQAGIFKLSAPSSPRFSSVGVSLLWHPLIRTLEIALRTAWITQTDLPTSRSSA